MREAISGTWLFQIVIVFVLLFSGYLAFSMNYSKAFKIKNEVIHIIERQKGINTESIRMIREYMDKIGYKSRGDCSGGGSWIGLNRSGVGNSSGQYYLCIYKIDTTRTQSFVGELPTSSYFSIESFFQLDIPIISRIFKLTVNGDTSQILYPYWEW